MSKKSSRFSPAQRGLTLIELMIAMILGLLILLAVLYIFQGSRKTYGYNEELSRVQENGRIAIDIINNDLRMAGYYYGGPIWRLLLRGGQKVTDYSGDNVVATIANITSPPVIDLSVSGTAGTGATPGEATHVATLPGAVATGTDAVTITRITQSFPVQAQDKDGISISNAFNVTSINNGENLLLASCRGLVTLTVASVNANPATLSNTIIPTVPIPDERNKNFGNAGRILRFGSVQYSIQNTGRKNAAGDAVYSLFRGNQELVEGVEDMQISLGKGDENNDGSRPRTVTGYVALASASGLTQQDWGDATALRVSLRVTSVENVLENAPPSIDSGGILFTPRTDDRRIHQIFSTTVALRNRTF